MMQELHVVPHCGWTESKGLAPKVSVLQGTADHELGDSVGVSSSPSYSKQL